MNNQEAKFILSGYRPNGGDAGDEMFGDALRQAQQDPALAAWFAREQAYDQAVAARLAEIAPPAELRADILAGVRASKRSPRRRWSVPAWAGVAAAVMVGAAVAFWPVPLAPVPDRLADFAFQDMGRDHDGMHGETASALQARLSDPRTRLGEGVPLDFAALKTTGCRTLAFRGHSVLEVCFQREGSWFHFYVVRSEDFPDLPAGGKPRIVHRDGLYAASWADPARGFHYVVVGDAGAEAVRNLL